MALPATPPISMAQVRAEFGGTTSTPLSAYVRGGAYVPNTPANSGVPTSTPIRLAQLCGATALGPLTATASPLSLYGTRATPGTATTPSCTCAVANSVGSLSYSWVRVSGDTGINVSGAIASVTFSGTVNNTTPYRSGTWRCDVTDSVRGAVSSNTITVELEYVF
jgi:hypothetical protein